MSHPGGSYTLRTSIARPTPYALSTAIVRTLCLATVISRPSARNRILFALCRTGRRSALPRRLCVCAQRVSSFYDFSNYPPFPFPYLPLDWSRGVGSAVSPRVAPPIFHPRSKSGDQSRAPLLPSLSVLARHECVGDMAFGTNSLACGFNWKCTANTIGCAATWSEYACKVSTALGTYSGLLTVSSLFTVWVHPGRKAAEAGIKYCHTYTVQLTVVQRSPNRL